jgi:hypothetical protein
MTPSLPAVTRIQSLRKRNFLSLRSTHQILVTVFIVEWLCIQKMVCVRNLATNGRDTGIQCGIQPVESINTIHLQKPSPCPRSTPGRSTQAVLKEAGKNAKLNEWSIQCWLPRAMINKKRMRDIQKSMNLREASRSAPGGWATKQNAWHQGPTTKKCRNRTLLNLFNTQPEETELALNPPQLGPHNSYFSRKNKF